MSINFEPLYIWQADEQQIKSPASARNYVQVALQQAGNVENLLAFAKEIQAYADERPKEDYVRECFGSMVSIASKCNCRALRFKAEFPIEDAYLYVVVNAAKHAGLTVYDPNNGSVFFPSGRVLPPNVNNWWNAIVAEQEKEAQLLAANPTLPKSRDQFEEWAAPVYKEALQLHGFIEQPKKPTRYGNDIDLDYTRVYVRETAIGQQIIRILYEGVYPYFFGWVEFEMSYSPIMAEISKKIEQDHNTFLFSKYIFRFKLTDTYLPIGTQIPQTHITQFDRHQECDLIVKEIIPRFNQMLDLAGLDKFLNSRDDVIFKNCDVNDREVKLIYLLLAKLAKNPNFEKLVAAFKMTSQWKRKVKSNTEGVYLKIIDDIRNWPC